MANLDFYALQPDILLLAEFLFENEWRVYESYSAYGKELTEYFSADELLAAYSALPVHKNGYTMLLQIWHPSCEGKPAIERVSLDPSNCQGHTFRYRIGGWGMMQLYFGGACEETIITHSHFGHWSEKGARKWEGITVEYGPINAWDWNAVEKSGRAVMYYVRKKLAAAKSGSRPVLASAAEFRDRGYSLQV